MKKPPKEYAVSQHYKFVGGLWCESTDCQLYIWFLNSYKHATRTVRETIDLKHI